MFSKFLGEFVTLNVFVTYDRSEIVFFHPIQRRFVAAFQQLGLLADRTHCVNYICSERKKVLIKVVFQAMDLRSGGQEIEFHEIEIGIFLLFAKSIRRSKRA